MTKKEIIELYLADLNNLVPDSEAKRSRIIDLEDELEALRIHDVVGRSEQLVCSCGSRLVKTTGGYHCGNAKCSV